MHLFLAIPKSDLPILLFVVFPLLIAQFVLALITLVRLAYCNYPASRYVFYNIFSVIVLFVGPIISMILINKDYKANKIKLLTAPNPKPLEDEPEEKDTWVDTDSLIKTNTEILSDTTSTNTTPVNKILETSSDSANIEIDTNTKSDTVDNNELASTETLADIQTKSDKN